MHVILAPSKKVHDQIEEVVANARAVFTITLDALEKQLLLFDSIKDNIRDDSASKIMQDLKDVTEDMMYIVNTFDQLTNMMPDIYKVDQAKLTDIFDLIYEI